MVRGTARCDEGAALRALCRPAAAHTPTHKVAKHVLKADSTLKDRAIDLQKEAIGVAREDRRG